MRLGLAGENTGEQCKVDKGAWIWRLAATTAQAQDVELGRTPADRERFAHAGSCCVATACTPWQGFAPQPPVSTAF